MKIGYARVSTQDQNLDMQLNELTKLGCSEIYREKVSGENTERTELKSRWHLERQAGRAIA